LQAIFERDLKALPATMKLILEKLKLKLRVEQVIVLNMLLRSNKKFTIIQLGTGFGKSRSIVGPLSDAVRWATKLKSIVIVPTKILRATNQDYCITAN
jgi:superfamily II DNA or RNA helicase